MPQVHPTAILEGDIAMADDVVIGPGCVLTGPIGIGPGTQLCGNAYLQGPLTLGPSNAVYPFVCLGFAPQHTKFDRDQPGAGLIIGEGNTFREHVTIHRAFAAEEPTRIGDRNLFMATTHAGHDCQIGSDCTLVNGAALGGHVVVEDRATVGGLTGVHQFCRIGRGAMLGAGLMAAQDVPPWFMMTGHNMCGAINRVGLRRSGATPEMINDVRWVYRTVCRSGITLKHAIEALRERMDNPLIAEYVQFLERSKRGVATARWKSSRGTASASASET